MVYKVNILGSCVSRVIMLDGDRNGHGIADNNLSMDYFLDKQNIACAMMPPAFLREEVDAIPKEELWDSNRLKSLKQCLNKDTIKLLMESDAEWLVLDFYDMQADVTIYRDTAFSSCAYEFYNTALYKKRNPTDFKSSNFCLLPSWIWYAYADLFFQTVLPKYDANHIILNRFRSNTWYLSKQGGMERVPDNFKMPYHSNDKYNEPLRRFEDYIIEKYHPFVIDLSRFFMGDENAWENLNGAHFETEFYRESFDIIKEIILEGSQKKTYNYPKLMDFARRGYEEDKKRNFDVDQGLEMIQSLLNQNDFLWLNLLDKLATYAPENEMVQLYVEKYKEVNT